MVVDEALRDAIRDLVAGIRPLDVIEASTQASVLEWIDSGEPLFREHGAVPPRHLAVFFALLDDAAGTVMQVDHVKAGRWVFAGGHNDGELPDVTVVREASEELGVAAEFHPAIGSLPLFVTESRVGADGDPMAHTDVTLWYVIRGQEGMPIQPDPREFAGIRWVRLADVDRWVGDCFAPDQVSRFVTKLSGALESARVTV
ncbi:NUDIX hydrolase [Catenuloplanes atrovinosus]|uniref:8-oxo-dGTP pyrophosphatase MutT (NUDIX family) n=1 Tax=Catenuloplanes atrovinosus TaxID=137266 RepID=A0AAE3YSB0_9ACTN|nr:NUDIX hydrolase [Catenuloplanes atrovinosus]MDR7277726.1 8-oxo-dGTP pyrophosphatase MutT (NUDIX family) [Catenuloplanes atrovinosus]